MLVPISSGVLEGVGSAPIECLVMFARIVSAQSESKIKVLQSFTAKARLWPDAAS